jgi:DNA repair photolyase
MLWGDPDEGESMTKTGVEYADEQITVYPTCPFGCTYCWSKLPLFRKRISNPRPFEEANRLKRTRKRRRVVVSFTTDPYQPRELTHRWTRAVLAKLMIPHDGDHLYQLHEVFVLTKNPMLALSDAYNWRNYPFFHLGTTLTSTDPLPTFEPKAPPNPERIEALREAHAQRIKTWVSIEPWIPEVTDPCRIIEKTHECVDWYVIGRLNHERELRMSPVPSDYYTGRLQKVVSLLTELGKPFLIKKELRQMRT